MPAGRPSDDSPLGRGTDLRKLTITNRSGCMSITAAGDCRFFRLAFPTRIRRMPPRQPRRSALASPNGEFYRYRPAARISHARVL